MDGWPPTKLDKLLGHMRAGRWPQALATAAKWPRLGEQETAIRLGHEAAAHGAFYRQLGRDTDAMIAEGIAALRARYGHLL